MPDSFREGLNRIRAAAEAAGGEITVGEILKAFPGFTPTDEQIAAIYEFLDSEGIAIADYEPHDTRSVMLRAEDLDEEAGEDYEADYEDEPQAMTGRPAPEAGDNDEAFAGDEEEELLAAVRALSPEEQRPFQMYWEDVAAVSPLSEAEAQELAGRLARGEREAAGRLLEGSLREIVLLAASHAGGGMMLTDLVQEGNMALFLALEEYDASQSFGDFVRARVSAAMKSSLREQASFERASDRMALEANRILETTKRLEEEYDRPVSAKELSEELGIPQTRIEEVVRSSLKAIENAQSKSGS